MNPYIEIFLDDKIYSQRTPTSKFIRFNLDGIKEESYESLPLDIKELVDISIEMEKNPKRYFDYSIQNDYIVIHKIKNTTASYIKIPETIEGLPVELLDSNLCEKIINSVKQIQLPETITQFSESTFANCTNLEYINIPKKMWFIPANCFENCYALKEINLENIKQIKKMAFMGCYKLKKIKCKKLKELGDKAFVDCKKLTEVIINSDLKIIPRTCFGFCNSLEKIELPDSIEIIKEHAFQSCGYLEKFIAPKNLRKIEKMAFYQNNLTQVVLNDQLKFIGDRAFESLTNVKTKVLINKNTTRFFNSFHRNAIIKEIDKNKINPER